MTINLRKDQFLVEPSVPQFKLMMTDARFPAFVGGFGSGKTEALINRSILKKLAYPTGNFAYYLPTFDLVSMIAFPRFEEKLEAWQIPYKAIKSPRPHIDIENNGSFIFRTLDNPNRIVGYETMDSAIDELDILKIEDARNAWNKILARNRSMKPDGKANTVAVGCTPEGFKFMYEQWEKNKEKNAPNGYELIRASTYSNAHNLPENYIQDLLNNYPTNLILAYINGEFVNLTSGSVYPDFDRSLNGSTETIGLINGQAEDLYIGMDFNVTKMAAVIFVRRNGWPHAVAEITGVFDTPAMIKAIKARFPNNRIFVFPDASGGSRKSNDASTSDIALLKQAGFYVFANGVNPAVRDRVVAMNILIRNAKDERHFFVNIAACPQFVEGLEKQIYDKNGEPDKTSGLDHALDAGGYFIAYNFPVRGKPMSRLKMVGI